MKQALCVSDGNISVTPHPLLLSLLGPVGNAENAKLVSRAKQVQSRGDQPQLVKKHRVKLISNDALLQDPTFVP